MRWVIVRVLPVPAPARMQTGPDTAWAAARCSSSSCASTASAPCTRTSPGAPAIVDIERDPAAAELVMQANGGNRTVPTLLFRDGSALTNPSIDQVKAQLEQSA